MNTELTIGKKIQLYRKQKHLTQKQLANLVSVNEITIRSYEGNRFRPKYDTVIALCKALEVPLDALLPETKGNLVYATYDTNSNPEKSNIIREEPESYNTGAKVTNIETLKNASLKQSGDYISLEATSSKQPDDYISFEATPSKQPDGSPWLKKIQQLND